MLQQNRTIGLFYCVMH